MTTEVVVFVIVVCVVLEGVKAFLGLAYYTCQLDSLDGDANDEALLNAQHCENGVAILRVKLDEIMENSDARPAVASPSASPQWSSQGAASTS